MKKLFIFISIISSIALATKVNLYEVDGTKVDNANRAKGPKALVKKDRTQKGHGVESVYAIQDTFNISSKDSVAWLEMEKNTDYTICTDDAHDGMWKGTGFSFKKENNCIQLNSGNYVKSGKIWYVTNMGNVHTFNLLVGMKYVDLTTQEHLIGTDLHCLRTKSGNCVYKDPIRRVRIEKILAVDKYKVTDCEFVHALWDSIPVQKNKNLDDNNNFWIEKKMLMKKNEYCDAHDSAAIRVHLYHAFIYANVRSLRDGFKPVYSFKKTESMKRSFDKKDGSFNIDGTSFFANVAENIKVVIDENADGYRLPYYDEWMAFSRGGTGTYGEKNLNDSTRKSQYAWFGVQESDDFYSNLDKNKFVNKITLKHSCGLWKQKSRPVGMLKSNDYGLYDVLGLVCERVMLPGKSLFHNEVSSCKGGFLTSSVDELNVRNHCDDDGFASKLYQGLRLVRQIK